MTDLFGDNFADLQEFLAFFVVAVILTIIFVGVYSTVTRHKEIKLIKEKSTAAAIAFSGSLIGFAMPLASAMMNSVTILEMVVWGVVALIVQIVVYLLVRLPMPRISERITANEVAAGIWLGATSLVAGILNAASMTT
jgi:putative membrane protein